MQCAHPILMRHPHTLEVMEVPCGTCMCCRVTKQSNLIFFSTRELITTYRKKYGASLITLTYNDNHVPISPLGYFTLRKSDVQKFMKRLRKYVFYHHKQLGLPINHKIKYLYCGEYGGQTNRPHYHVIIYGLSATQLRVVLPKVWKQGNAEIHENKDKVEKTIMGRPDIQPLDSGAIKYVTKYITKGYVGKEWKQMMVYFGMEPEFICKSQRMGYEWIEQNAEKLIESEGYYNNNGKKALIPSSVRKKLGIKLDLSVINNAIAKQASKAKMTIEEFIQRERLRKEEMLIKKERAKLHPVDDRRLLDAKKQLQKTLLRIHDIEQKRKLLEQQRILEQAIWIHNNIDSNKDVNKVFNRCKNHMESLTGFQKLIDEYLSKEVKPEIISSLADQVLEDVFIDIA